VKEAISFDQDGIGALEILRQGFLRSLPKLIGVPAEVDRIRSISNGDALDTYLIRFGAPEAPVYH
jgi:hypothetical protein